MKPTMWRRSDKDIPLDLDGYIFLMYEDNDQPVLGPMGGKTFLAVFSTVEKLEAYLPYLNPPDPVKIKQVNKGGTDEFVESIHEHGVEIMIDPYVHKGKNTRFVMVFREDRPGDRRF